MKVECDRKRFRKMFPNLSKELGTNENRVGIDSVRSSAETEEEKSPASFHHYAPDVIDFVRRCDTKEQAEEIIAYLERRGEIGQEYADRLRRQLMEKGVRSFGSKKEKDYYLKHGEL